MVAGFATLGGGPSWNSPDNIKDGSYEHPRDTGWKLVTTGTPGAVASKNAHELGRIPDEDFDRLERWMAWKSGETAVQKLHEQLAKATARKSRSTPVKLGDLVLLLAMVELGGEPR